MRDPGPIVAEAGQGDTGNTEARNADARNAAVAAAARVSALFLRVQETIAAWREAILAGGAVTNSTAGGAAALDERVSALVLPALREEDPLLIGAGFIAVPEFLASASTSSTTSFATASDTGELHFAWWMGPLEENPIFGATTEPTRLDLAARAYSDYLRDFRSLEWYSTPQSTHRTHITGPYVDHLCACDYIVTVTAPVEVEGCMIGVVGVDLAVKRLERELLPAMLGAGTPLALVNDAGRVTVSTDPWVPVGTVIAVDEAIVCAGTTFRLALTSHSR